MERKHYAEGWLTVRQRSGYTYATDPDLIAKWTTSKPTLAPDEVAVKLRVELPASVFAPKPITATVVIPEADVVTPDVTVLAEDDEQ